MRANLRRVRRVDGKREVGERGVAVFRLVGGRTAIEAADDHDVELVECGHAEVVTVP